METRVTLMITHISLNQHNQRCSLDIDLKEAAGRSGQRVGLVIRRSRVIRLVASCQFGFLILLCSVIFSNYLSGMPVN